MSSVLCEAKPCPVILSSTCVFYEGDNLVYTGINTNDSLQVALQKIDAKFQDAGLGYIFTNGVIQTAPGQPVKLGGSLTEDTTINSSGWLFKLTGNIEAAKFITTGGTSSQFVKGDGSLDNTSYQPAGSYITSLTGDGTASGPGSAVFTLNSIIPLSAGTWGSSTQVPIVTVNAKGLVTGITQTLITVPSDLVIVSGPDMFGSGVTGTGFSITLSTVNANAYGTNTPLKFAVNGKGRVTSAAPLTNLDLDTIYGYTPVPTTRTITINGVTQNLAANRTWTIPNVLPSQAGNAGKYLTTNGSAASWVSLPPSGVANVTASLPLSSTGGATPNISITQSSALTDGYLSSTDWNTFNNKLSTILGLNISLLTNDSGYITLPSLSGGTGISYNNLTGVITNSAPDQTVVLSSGTGISISGTYPNFTITNSSPSSGGTVTSVAALTLGTSGTDLSSSVANSTTTPVITLNVPTASATNRGALSSSDWTTFNNKQNAISLTTTGTSGAATFIADTLNIPQYQAALTNPVTGTGTNNEIAYFNTTGSTIGSLSTATYPSLTEISYIKGVTSSIQIQLNKALVGTNLFLYYNNF